MARYMLDMFRCQKNYNSNPEYLRKVMIKKFIAIAVISTLTSTCYALEKNFQIVGIPTIKVINNIDGTQTAGIPTIKVINNIDGTQTAGIPTIKVINNIDGTQTAGIPTIKVINNIDGIQTAGIPTIKVAIKVATA
jgi:hypothetical protein